MKKRLLILALLFISLFLINLNFVISQEAIPENIPGGKIIEKVGEVDPSTGLPKKFSDFKERADEFRTGEQNQSYLWKEWSKILANNKFFGPVLFYTHKFFSFFNPFWKAVFGIEFSWSWAFILSFGLWIVFIILVYYPLKGLFKNFLVDIIVSIVIASLIGIAGTISRIVEFLASFVTNPIILVVIIIIIVLVIILYQQIMEKLIKESEQMELKRSKEAIKAHGKVSRGALKDMGSEPEDWL